MPIIDASKPLKQDPPLNFHPSEGALGKTYQLPFHPVQDVDSDGVLPDSPRLVSLRKTRDRWKKAKDRLPGERVCTVCGNPAGEAVNLKVTKTKRGNRASFEGLLSCGSVWLCPICAEKISRKKRLKLDAVLAAHHKAHPGATVLFLTLTVGHHYGQSLESVLDRLETLTRFVMTGRSGLTQSLKAAGVGYPGSLTVLEITHGGSGWHPHKHLALFLDSALSRAQVTQLEAALRKKAAASGKGHRDDLYFDPEIAISLQAGITGTYLSKWGLPEELSLSASKDGRTSGNKTPWELLDSDDPESSRLWAEYAAATKGKRQSRYSNGLLAALDVQPEVSDEDLAAEPETGPDPVVFTLTLSRSEYMLIHRKRRHADVLYLAADKGPEAVFHLLDSLANDPPFKPNLTG